MFLLAQPFFYWLIANNSLAWSCYNSTVFRCWTRAPLVTNHSIAINNNNNKLGNWFFCFHSPNAILRVLPQHIPNIFSIHVQIGWFNKQKCLAERQGITRVIRPSVLRHDFCVTIFFNLLFCFVFDRIIEANNGETTLDLSLANCIVPTKDSLLNENDVCACVL